MSAAHSYAAAGTYSVQLTVTDNQGASNTATKSVTVAGSTGGDSVFVNGVAKTNLSGSTGTEAFFTLDVSAKATALSFVIAGGTGDADLYVRKAAQPTISAYDCRPYKGGNTESCSFNNPAAGTWYISIRGYSAYSGVNLDAEWKP